ncbi:hypothetical protein SERLA73DRAFT_71420 [Serpula lacrymans var. lacrymans S7.3]|uniref:DUF6533 domain-containing protein n=1 Tax=Serpula lacrymans var. lacrymans (strain S7.3) TaxID=936435 RepID=F8PQT2_SERL3|nr:hypothetical protein SERLA73DRAFT_71420 [Serpula lacrymans var. lacrymans S7.3]
MSAQILNDVRLVRSMNISSYALLSWDYLLTLQDEVHYIWRSPRSYFKVLFLANRYGNLAFQALALAQHSSSFQSAFPSLCSSLSFASAHAMVLLRAWAIHRRSRKLAFGLSALFAVYIALCIGLFTRGLVHNRRKPFDDPRISHNLMLAGQTDLYLLEELVPEDYQILNSSIKANIFGNTLNLILWVKFPDRPRGFMGSVFTLTLISVTGQRLAIRLRKIGAQSTEATQSRLSKEIDNQINALLPQLQSATNINERIRGHEVDTGHSGDRPTTDLEEARGRSSGEEIEVECRTITQI